MKWHTVYLKDGSGAVDQDCVQSDTHTIVRGVKEPPLFLVFRKAKPMAYIIGRFSTPAAARKCCDEDYPGKPFPPDTVGTYPEGRPTLDRTPEAAGQEDPSPPVP
jgi:hypothetical protein